MRCRRVRIMPLTLLFILFGCSPEPKPIQFNVDKCDYCVMQISDIRYGAELVTNKGKIYKFDAVECLAAFLNAGEKGSDDVHSLWLINYQQPKTFVAADSAKILLSRSLKSPMSLNLTAFRSMSAAEKYIKQADDRLLTWEQTRNYVKSKWSRR